MVGLRRVLGSARALFCIVAIGGAIANCSSAPDGTPPSAVDAGGAFSEPSDVFPTSGGTAPMCQPPNTPNPVFAAEMFPGPLAVPWDFYSWTTPADEQTLRATKKLFGQNPSASATVPLARLKALNLQEANAIAFVSTLRTTFQSGRFAWGQPWASRLSSADSGGQLIHVTLRSDAWIAVVQDTDDSPVNSLVSVYDSARAPVSSADQYAHPERIGAIFFGTLSPDCERGAATQWRGFLLGNEAMVQQWSLGTQEILTRLRTDIQDLSQFLINIRTCPTSADTGLWVSEVPCKWQNILTGSTGGAAGATGVDGGIGFDFAGAPGRAGTGANGGASGGANAGGTGGLRGTGIAGVNGVAGANSGGTASNVATNFDTPEALQNGTEEFAYVGTLATANASYFPQPRQISAIIDTLQGDLFDPDPLIVTPGSP